MICIGELVTPNCELFVIFWEATLEIDDFIVIMRVIGKWIGWVGEWK